MSTKSAFDLSRVDERAKLYTAILAHVRAQGPCSLYELHATFGEKPNDFRLRNLVQILEDQGKLVNVSETRNCRWIIGDGTRAGTAPHKPRREQCPTPIVRPVQVGPITPPRQIDLIRAPVYVPPARAIARPGAADFLQIPSRGCRC